MNLLEVSISNMIDVADKGILMNHKINEHDGHRLILHDRNSRSRFLMNQRIKGPSLMMTTSVTYEHNKGRCICVAVRFIGDREAYDRNISMLS